jgi:ribonuclease Z
VSDAFQPRLVNGPFEDPALYVPFRYQRRALLFDLGNIDSLSLREIHRITDVFVSHTHIDHFIGFDHLLRGSLNREDEIRLYGPRGIVENVRGKLAGYSWNLIENYPCKIAVYEIDGGKINTVLFRAINKFRSEQGSTRLFDKILLDESSFSVEAAILDHRIPCLAFCLKEKTRLNVRRERLEEMGLEAGPWLDELKRLLRKKVPGTTWIQAPGKKGGTRDLILDQWREALILETEGQKIAYVVDTLFCSDNMEQIVSLAQDADLFYCEASFSKQDEDRAKERYHLTAEQAGILARMAQVKRFVPFHFSLRYEAEPNRLLEEALEAFGKAETRANKQVGSSAEI